MESAIAMDAVHANKVVDLVRSAGSEAERITNSTSIILLTAINRLVQVLKLPLPHILITRTAAHAISL